jgi:hypothetical protein
MRSVLRILAAAMALSLVAVAEGPSGFEVLRKAAYYQDDVPHRGKAVTSVRTPDGHEMRFTREVYAGHRGAYHIRMPAPPPTNQHLVISDGKRRWRVMGDDDVALVSPPLDFAKERKRRVGFARRMEHDSRAMISTSRLCGRSTWRIRVERKNPKQHGSWVPVRALHIDQATYLELGNTTYGMDGKPVSSTEYESVSFLSDEDINERWLTYEPKGHTLTMPDPSHMGWPERYRDASKRVPWLVPLRDRPAGWRPGGVAVHCFGHQQVAHFMYLADGGEGKQARPVALLEKPKDGKSPHLDEYYSLDTVTDRPTARRQAVVWSDGDVVYVLAAALPQDELMRAAWRHVRAGAGR